MLFFQISLRNLTELCNGSFSGNNIDFSVNNIIFDSRASNLSRKSIFVALIGENHDGHDYIEQLYNFGLRCFMVNRSYQIINKEANYIIVKNTLSAFQLFAKEHRLKYNIPMIGITGSYGKTIVKNWLSECLSKKFKVVNSPKSYNSQIGVPLSLLKIDDHHEIGVFEAGISRYNEMRAIGKIMLPTIGIFTNIGNEHSENFFSIKEKVQEKLLLFNKKTSVLYCKDYKEIDDQIKLKNFEELITWSTHDRSANFFVEIKTILNTTEVIIYNNESNFRFRTSLAKKPDIENCIHVICSLLFLKLNENYITNAVKKLTTYQQGFIMKGGKNQNIIINDNNPLSIDSVKIGVEFLKKQNVTKNSILILSNPKKNKYIPGSFFKRLALIAKEYKLNLIIGIGVFFKTIENYIPNSVYFRSQQSFIRKFQNIISYSGILICDENITSLKTLSKVFEKKIHETCLEISLNSLSKNFHYYKNKLSDKTKIMVMVKSFSYGYSSYEVAKQLEYNGVDYLAVAYTDEGVVLRKKGIKSKILVLNSRGENLSKMIEFSLEPNIYDFDQLFKILEQLKVKNIQGFRVHVEIDTGMNRLGFKEYELEKLIKAIKLEKQIKVTSVFSHLANSSKKNCSYTKKQIDNFSRICELISNALNYNFQKHILNSAGIENYNYAEFDMVRLGIGLYGFGNKSLENISSFKSIISQIKHVKKNEFVGYNKNFKAENRMKIGIIPVGYADGLNRKLSINNGYLYLNGKKAELVGDICMDMCMIDLSKHKYINIGDEVIIWSKQKHISDIAKKSETICYEVLTNLSPRIKRVFIED